MKTRPRHSNPLCIRRSGTSAVEFVCVLPVCVAIVLGAVDLGRFAHYDNVLSNAARVGAEYGATHRRTARNLLSWEQRTEEAVQAEAAHLPNYEADLLEVTVTNIETPGELRTVEVTASYPFETIVNWPGIPDRVDFELSVSYQEYR
jgi:Flp pilus assembly protein TadG